MKFLHPVFLSVAKSRNYIFLQLLPLNEVSQNYFSLFNKRCQKPTEYNIMETIYNVNYLNTNWYKLCQNWLNKVLIRRQLRLRMAQY